MAEKLGFQCEGTLLSKYIFIHPRGSINKELLFPKQPLSHAEQLMEQRATFVHTQSDTHGYRLLLEPGAAGEALLCDHRHQPLITPHGASGPTNGILFRRVQQAGMQVERNILHVKLMDCFTLHSTSKSLLLFFTLKKKGPLCHLLLYFHTISNVQSTLSTLGYREHLRLVFSL